MHLFLVPIPNEGGHVESVAVPANRGIVSTPFIIFTYLLDENEFVTILRPDGMLHRHIYIFVAT